MPPYEMRQLRAMHDRAEAAAGCDVPFSKVVRRVLRAGIDAMAARATGPSEEAPEERGP